MESFFETGEGVCFICGRSHKAEIQTWVTYGDEDLKIVCFKESCIKEAEKESS